MFIPKNIIQDIGMLDEAYFLYYEDVDYCMRARRKGHELWYEPFSIVDEIPHIDISKAKKILGYKPEVPEYSADQRHSTLADKTQLAKKQIVCVFDELTVIISAHLKKDGPEKFVLPGIFKIVVKKVPAKPAREGKNPFTGELMMFKAKPASKKVKVIAMKQLKELIS